MYWQVGVAVRLHFCIRDVLGSNRGRNTGCADLASCGFPQTFQKNGITIPALGYKLSFQNFQHTIHYYYHYHYHCYYYYSSSSSSYYYYYYYYNTNPYYVGPLSQRHGASSGCGWRRRPPVIEGSCEYIE
jgi:hypothetical protein